MGVCVCVSTPVPKDVQTCRGLWVHFHARANEDRESMDVQMYLPWCTCALCKTQLGALLFK